MCDECWETQAEMYEEEAAILVQGIEDAIKQITASPHPGWAHAPLATLRGTLRKWREAQP